MQEAGYNIGDTEHCVQLPSPASPLASGCLEAELEGHPQPNDGARAWIGELAGGLAWAK